MTDVFARVSDAWVGASGDPNNPPPTEQPRWAGHVVDRVLLGMCVQTGASPTLSYATAVTYTGAPYARRSFGGGNWITANAINSWIDECEADSIYPWISFKVPGNDWAGVVNGQYDSGLNIILERAAARSETWMFTVHHEPSGDGPIGDPANNRADQLANLELWGDMQTYVSNYVASASDKVCFAPIMNGFPWGPKNYDAAAIAAAYPQSLIDTINANGHILTCDTYDSADNTKLSYTSYDRTSLKMSGFFDWCRANGVQSAGIGEWGCHTGEDVRRCWNLCATNSDLVGISVYFNSGANSRANWLLVPDAFDTADNTLDGTAESELRMDYFILALAASATANPATVAAI